MASHVRMGKIRAGRRKASLDMSFKARYTDGMAVRKCRNYEVRGLEMEYGRAYIR